LTSYAIYYKLKGQMIQLQQK